MSRRSAIPSLMVASAVSFLPCLGSGPPASEQKDYIIRSEVRLVLLDVSVKDREGRPVAGLTKDNFTVTENGRPQPTTVFDKNDLPVTIGILVDESLSMTPKRADVLNAAETFIQESNPRDEVFVLNFNDNVTRGLPKSILFSDSIQQLRSALHRGVPQGKTALHDAVVAGLEQLALGRRDKKALVVISDGGDNASRHNRREMLGMVDGSIATIYTIGLFNENDPERDLGILRRLAKISGGEAYFPATLKDMVPVCRGMARDIRARYTIGYPPPAGNGTDSLRHIRLRASAPGRGRLITRTRSSYRYEELENHTTK